MITLGVIDARIKRQKLAEQAGAHFVPRDKVKGRIQALRNFPDRQFLFALFEDENTWTAISVDSIIGCYHGEISELNIQTEADIFHEFFGQPDGKQKSDVFLGDGRKFWMKSVGISCSIQNIMLSLQTLPEGTFLEE